MGTVYDTREWADARDRVIARDQARCTVARLLGGACAPGPLHVHHIVPVDDGGAEYDDDNLATVCATHHALWEALRRRVVEIRRRDEPRPIRCPHRHVHALAREECERRLRRELAVA